MPPVNHTQDRIMFGLFRRESSYATAPEWGSAGCRMTDYDHNSPHAIWDDQVDDNELLGHHAEYATTQVLARQSVRLQYVEPRAHPNTLGGLLTLALGNRVTVQDGALAAYRHAISLAGANVSLSMSAQVAHVPSSQYQYTGLKADTFALRNNGPFLTLICDMLGSGARPAAATTFPGIVDDPWLLWGDCHIWLKDVTGTPLTLPDTPAQGTTNLGGGTVDISSRIVRLEYLQPNHLWAEGGYRPSSGKVRASLYPTRREAGIVLELDVDAALETTEVNYYQLQRALALEWQCVGALIAPSGTFRYGFSLLLPCLRFRRLAFGEHDAVETFVFEGLVMEDGVNPGVQAWVYTSQPVYLGDALVLVPGFTAAWSTRKLVPTYSGPCLRVRRSSDQTTLDIGFVGDQLDTAALLAFVGAGTGSINIWYDQGGNATRNFFEVTPALGTAPPKIVINGVLQTTISGQPSIVFNGTNELLITASAAMNQFITVNTGTVASVFEAAAVNGTEDAVWACHQTQVGALITNVGPTIYSRNESPTNTYANPGKLLSLNTSSLHMWRHGSNVVDCFLNGASPSSQASGTTVAGLNTAMLAGRNSSSGAFFLQGAIAEIITYNVALDASQIAQLAAFMIEPYSIAWS